MEWNEAVNKHRTELPSQHGMHPRTRGPWSYTPQLCYIHWPPLLHLYTYGCSTVLLGTILLWVRILAKHTNLFLYEPLTMQYANKTQKQQNWKRDEAPYKLPACAGWFIEFRINFLKARDFIYSRSKVASWNSTPFSASPSYATKICWTVGTNAQ